jgi:hypothetical protein
MCDIAMSSSRIYMRKFSRLLRDYGAPERTYSLIKLKDLFHLMINYKQVKALSLLSLSQ